MPVIAPDAAIRLMLRLGPGLAALTATDATPLNSQQDKVKPQKLCPAIVFLDIAAEEEQRQHVEDDVLKRLGVVHEAVGYELPPKERMRERIHLPPERIGGCATWADKRSERRKFSNSPLRR